MASVTGKSQNKRRESFRCNACGVFHAGWAGRCDSCGAWNQIEAMAASSQGGSGQGTALNLEGIGDRQTPPERLITGIGELDRVLGGGAVAGSTVLVGGDPGIGKSTLLLQAAAKLARPDLSSTKEPGSRAVWLLSGEEANPQVRERAGRLKIESGGLLLGHVADTSAIAHAIDRDHGPCAVIIDSVQTLFLPELDAGPGSIPQLRASVERLAGIAKRRSLALLLTAHVTKDGMIAGPRAVEHLVDCVLYFEGQTNSPYRILRAVKNRFGSADEIGVFDMRHDGLTEVTNPSAMFIANRNENAAGSVIFASTEGSRALLAEVQALVAPSHMASPRRTAIGWDSGRLAMVLAILDRHAGLSLQNQEVYIAIAGGLRVKDPGIDLAVAAALVSAATNRPIRRNLVVFGELGLVGDVRDTGRLDQRIREALRLGFSEIACPAHQDCNLDSRTKLTKRLGQITETKSSETVIRSMSHVSDLFNLLGEATDRSDDHSGRRQGAGSDRIHSQGKE